MTVSSSQSVEYQDSAGTRTVPGYLVCQLISSIDTDLVLVMECGMRNVMKAELATPAGLQERPGLLLINNEGLLPAEKYSPIYDEPHCY